MTYEALEVLPGTFGQAVAQFHTDGGQGLNITLPFKREAFELAGRHSSRAERAGAVNTIWFDGHAQAVGDNTDGAGLVADLTQNLSVDIKGSRILLVGAGGAARGSLPSLLDEKPNRVAIANRTHSRAENLAREFNDLGEVSALHFSHLANERFDIVINATAASLADDLLPLPNGRFADNVVCYDMMYADDETVFMLWARRNGAGLVADGLGMLVEQAAEAFFQWRGIRPATSEVLRALRPG